MKEKNGFHQLDPIEIQIEARENTSGDNDKHSLSYGIDVLAIALSMLMLYGIYFFDWSSDRAFAFTIPVLLIYSILLFTFGRKARSCGMLCLIFLIYVIFFLMAVA